MILVVNDEGIGGILENTYKFAFHESVFSSFIKFSTAKKHNHKGRFFGGKNGSCCSISFHMKMTPYVVVHSPHNWGFGQFIPKWEVLQIK